jgi:NAD-dependent dihydropyrimidine dehydrogenase PreA subunit
MPRGCSRLVDVVSLLSFIFLSLAPLTVSAAPTISSKSFPLTEDGTFGALSGLAFDSTTQTYWTHDDNRTGTQTTVQLYEFALTPTGVVRLQTVPLLNEDGTAVLSSNINLAAGLDPESIGIAPDGSFWMVEEEHQTLLHVSRAGQILSRHIPPGLEESKRVRGQGLESVAVSADGQTIFVGQQAALAAQVDKSITHIAVFTVATGQWALHQYRLDTASSYSYPAGLTIAIGMHDMKALGPDAAGLEQVLVIERDNQRGANARDKRLYRVHLPAIPAATPAVKELELDMVAAGYTLEKPEGLVVDAEHWVVINDNLNDPLDTEQLWVFAKPPRVACVGSSLAPASVDTDPGACTAAVNNLNQRAGSCVGGAGGLASCTFGTAVSLPLSVGSNSVAVAGAAVEGSADSCQSFVEVSDHEGPAIGCPASTLVECAGAQTPATVAVSCHDNCGSCTAACPAGAYPLGQSLVSCGALDSAGNSSHCTANVTVRDTLKPLVGLTLSPTKLWPPDNKLHRIAVASTSSDVCDPSPGVGCTASSNDSSHSHHAQSDVVWRHGKLYLRAERGQHGDRVYTVECTATDKSGNRSTTSGTVVVKH